MALDRNELKVQALLERLKDITTFYEDRDADRRVEITILGLENKNLTELLEQNQAQTDSLQAQLDNLLAPQPEPEATVADVVENTSARKAKKKT